MKEEFDVARATMRELEAELNESRDKEGELLEYMGKVTKKNAELQSELSALTIKVH